MNRLLEVQKFFVHPPDSNRTLTTVLPPVSPTTVTPSSLVMHAWRLGRCETIHGRGVCVGGVSDRIDGIFLRCRSLTLDLLTIPSLTILTAPQAQPTRTPIVNKKTHTHCRRCNPRTWKRSRITIELHRPRPPPGQIWTELPLDVAGSGCARDRPHGCRYQCQQQQRASTTSSPRSSLQLHYGDDPRDGHHQNQEHDRFLPTLGSASTSSHRVPIKSRSRRRRSSRRGRRRD
jgi:hypothetical protein